MPTFANTEKFGDYENSDERRWEARRGEDMKEGRLEILSEEQVNKGKEQEALGGRKGNEGGCVRQDVRVETR